MDTKDRIAHVKVGKVLAEAAGAILAGGLESGAKTYGVLDVGSYTTDIYTLTGLTPIADQCASYEAGVSLAVNDVASRFEAKHHFPLSQSQENSILTCYSSGNYEPMEGLDHSQVADIVMWTKEALTSLADNIRAKVAEYWRTGSYGLIAANFSRVEIVGGGAYYLTEFLQKSIPNLRMQKRPEYSNVRGYAGFANILLSQRNK